MGAVAAVGIVAPIVGTMAVGAVARVAGDHAKWHVINGTYNKTVETCTKVGGNWIGNCAGKLIAPSIALSPQTLETANALGGCFNTAVSTVGLATLGYFTGTESALSCGTKVAFGLGATALATFSVVNAPTIATVLTVVSVGQTVYSIWNAASAAQPEQPVQAIRQEQPSIHASRESLAEFTQTEIPAETV